MSYLDSISPTNQKGSLILPMKTAIVEVRPMTENKYKQPIKV